MEDFRSLTRFMASCITVGGTELSSIMSWHPSVVDASMEVVRLMPALALSSSLRFLRSSLSMSALLSASLMLTSP